LTIDNQLWASIKATERGFNHGNPETHISVRLDFAPQLNRMALNAALSTIGSLIKKQKRNSWLAEIPAVKVLEIWFQFGGEMQLAAYQEKPGNYKLRYFAAAGAVILAAALVWLYLGTSPPISNKAVDTQASTSAEPSPQDQDLYQAGLHAYKQGQKEQAVKYWTALVAKEPDRLGVRQNLGWLLYELGRRKEAAAQFRFILQVNPNHEEAQSALEIIQNAK
jgi:tetratricopeptide (TPR) repeat protein